MIDTLARARQGLRISDFGFRIDLDLSPRAGRVPRSMPSLYGAKAGNAANALQVQVSWPDEIYPSGCQGCSHLHGRMAGQSSRAELSQGLVGVGSSAGQGVSAPPRFVTGALSASV